MKDITRIAILFVILLVSVSAAPVFAGSPADTAEGSSSLAGADAGAVENDNQLSEEPLSEQTDSGDDSPGVDENPPTPTVSPPQGADPEPTMTEGPEQDGAPAENITGVEETPTPTASPSQGADPEPTMTEGPEQGGAPAENATAPQPTDAIVSEPSPNIGEVENESALLDSQPVSGMAGESYSPVAVLCIWEQLALAEGRLDDDLTRPGSQFLPPCAYGAVKTIQVSAVVTGSSTAPDRVVADVTSPGGSPFARVNLTRQGSDTDALEAASMAELVTYAYDMSLSEAVRALERGGAMVYAGELDLLFSQAPGDYNVSVQVRPEEGEPIGQPLAGVFTYLPTASFEIDFATVDYGMIKSEEDAWVEGDASFGTAERPTVRTTGNVPISISIIQDNMGLDMPASYMARLGNDESVAFGAMEEVTLPGTLPVNETKPISLALRVPAGSKGTPDGRLQISCIPYQGEQ